VGSVSQMRAPGSIAVVTWISTFSPDPIFFASHLSPMGILKSPRRETMTLSAQPEKTRRTRPRVTVHIRVRSSRAGQTCFLPGDRVIQFAWNEASMMMGSVDERYAWEKATTGRC